MDEKAYAQMSLMSYDDMYDFVKKERVKLEQLKRQLIAEQGPSFLSGEERTEKMIEKRSQQEPQAKGSLFDVLPKGVEALANMLPPVMAPRNLRMAESGMRAGAEGLTRTEAAIANPMMEMQKGEFDKKALWDATVSGITKERVGQFGDVFRQAGAPDWVAAPLGMMALSALYTGSARLLKGGAQLGAKILRRTPALDKMATDAGNQWVQVATERLEEARNAYKTLINPFNSQVSEGGATMRVLNMLPPAMKKRVLRVITESPVPDAKPLVDAKGRPILKIGDLRDIWFELEKSAKFHGTRMGMRVKKEILNQLPVEVASKVKSLDKTYQPIKHAALRMQQLIKPDGQVVNTGRIYDIVNNPLRAGHRQFLSSVKTLGMDTSKGMQLAQKWAMKLNAQQRNKMLGKLIATGVSRGAGLVAAGAIGGAVVKALRD